MGSEASQASSLGCSEPGYGKDRGGLNTPPAAPAYAEELNAGDWSNLGRSKRRVLFSVPSSEPCRAGLSRNHISGSRGRSQRLKPPRLRGVPAAGGMGKPSGMGSDLMRVFSNKQGISHPRRFFEGCLPCASLLGSSGCYGHRLAQSTRSRQRTAERAAALGWNMQLRKPE